MMIKVRLNGIILMSLILIFAIIHLGVSIGIIVRNSNYGTIFRPQIGLSAFNIAIAILGLVVGILGLICILKIQGVLRKIVAILSIILAIFALASLVTAIIMNAQSFSYVNTRFYNNMDQYANDQNAMNIVDRIQTNYRCCGETTWLDWARVPSWNTIVSTTTSSEIAATTVSGDTATTPSAETAGPSSATKDSTNDATTLSSETASLTSDTTGLLEESTSALSSDTTLLSKAKSVIMSPQIYSYSRRDIDTVNQLSEDPLSPSGRQRRAVPITGSSINLPYSNQIFVPASCCIGSGSSSPPSCSSSTDLYTNGCLTSLIQRVNLQDLGIGIINCFMIVLALAAIPFLLYKSGSRESRESIVYAPQLENMAKFDANPNNNFPSVLNTFH